MISRLLEIDLDDHNAAFLWGPRKVGKTTLLHKKFPQAKFFDFLDSTLKNDLFIEPKIFRERVLAEERNLIIVDEVQKVPAVLDEIHWCLENTKKKFILCGSSPRKLKRGAANLLGGRAWRFELYPLTTKELLDATEGKKALDLLKIFNHGLIPSHYFSKKPERSLRSYVADYLTEEIQAEALARNIPAFAKFLESAGISHGELINYSNIARDSGVSSKTVKEYYQILEDTLLGHTLEPWQKPNKRRLILTAKFYFFDLGVARALKGMSLVQPKTNEFGRAFEHFLIEEIRTYLHYTEKLLPISFWRTSTGFEVDLIIGEMEYALEFKANTSVKTQHLKGLHALLEEFKPRKALVISMDSAKRKTEKGIIIYPWQEFCRDLWGGKII